MKKEITKENYETARLEITLFGFSDIVTASGEDDKPSLDNMDSWA
jgi:hypothetical protein